MLRGIPLKTLEQKAQKEVRKQIESQRYSEFLALSSKILAFLSRHTTHINAMHAFCHKTIPLLENPKPLKLLANMSEMLLGETQSIFAD